MAKLAPFSSQLWYEPQARIDLEISENSLNVEKYSNLLKRPFFQGKWPMMRCF